MKGNMIDEKAQSEIIRLSKNGESGYKIAKKLGISFSSAYKYGELDKPRLKRILKKKQGRKKIIAKSEKRKIKIFLRNNPSSTAREVKFGLKLDASIRTIERTIGDLKFRWKRRRKAI